MTCQCFPFEDSGVVLLMLMSLQVMSGVVLCHEDTKDICMVAQGLWAHVWQRWTGGVCWGWTLPGDASTHLQALGH